MSHNRKISSGFHFNNGHRNALQLKVRSVVINQKADEMKTLTWPDLSDLSPSSAVWGWMLLCWCVMVLNRLLLNHFHPNDKLVLKHYRKNRNLYSMHCILNHKRRNPKYFSLLLALFMVLLHILGPNCFYYLLFSCFY